MSLLHALLPLAPARFVGVQDGFGIYPSFELFTLEAPVGIHPAGSTVSRCTLERHGYFVPAEVTLLESAGMRPLVELIA